MISFIASASMRRGERGRVLEVDEDEGRRACGPRSAARATGAAAPGAAGRRVARRPRRRPSVSRRTRRAGTSGGFSSPQLGQLTVSAPGRAPSRRTRTAGTWPGSPRRSWDTRRRPRRSLREARSGASAAARAARNMTRGRFDGVRGLAMPACEACGLFGRRRRDAGHVAAALRPRRFRRGETVFHAGDPGDALFIVAPARSRSSAVRRGLRAGDPDDDRARRVLRGAGAPRWGAALGDGVALDATETLVLPPRRLRSPDRRAAELRRALLASLATEIRRLTAQVEDLHFLDLPGRLARTSCAMPRRSTATPTARRRDAPALAVHPGRAGRA